MRTLIAVPVHNEIKTVRRVLAAIRGQADDILVIDDGSTDGTSQILHDLSRRLDLDLVRHEGNLGYGRSIRTAFCRAIRRGFDWVITMDCDEQHEPRSIPDFVRAARQDGFDMVSGSRYMAEPPADDPLATPPADRRAINRRLTAEINDRLGLSLTDSFCGFKAHRVEALKDLRLHEDGYAFPMQLWVQSVAAGHRIGELPVRLIYNDPNRTFGGGLDDAGERLRHYRFVLHRELRRWQDRLPVGAAERLELCGCGVA